VGKTKGDRIGRLLFETMVDVTPGTDRIRTRNSQHLTIAKGPHTVLRNLERRPAANGYIEIEALIPVRVEVAHAL